jgi:hypothetical protein
LRVLVDESLPVELAEELGLESVSTNRGEGWLGMRNGALLRAAVTAGFSVLLTADSQLQYQQNLSKVGIGVVVVRGVRNRIGDLRPMIPRIREAIARSAPGVVEEIVG